LDKLLDYTDEVLPVVSKRKSKECVNITYHSNFIRVGNSRIDYDDEKAVKKLLKGKKKVKKEKVNTVKYILDKITIV